MFPFLLGALGPAYNEFSYSSYRIVIIIIKMHSSRMRTVRCSGRRGGGGGGCLPSGVVCIPACTGQGGCLTRWVFAQCTLGYTSPVNRMTDACENITLSQLRCGIIATASNTLCQTCISGLFQFLYLQDQSGLLLFRLHSWLFN